LKSRRKTVELKVFELIWMPSNCMGMTSTLYPDLQPEFPPSQFYIP
jgi:hypothetical protein